MKIIYLEKARYDLQNMDENLAIIFIRHVDKVATLPPRRHLRFGMPFNVDEVGKGRLIYKFKDGNLFVVRCFSNHSDYEKWYKSYR